jgi:hypothetical protein
MRALPLLAVSLLAIHSLAAAAQQTVPGKIVIVKNAGNDPAGRKALYKTSDGPASTHGLVGDPTDGFGARLKIRLGSNTQCFDMPADNWRTVGATGFKYQDLIGAFGAVTLAQVKRTRSGVFQIKILMSGKRGPINVVPFQGSELDTNFSLAAGDEYCAAFGNFPGGGTVVSDGPKVYKVLDSDAPASCRVTACSPSAAFLDDASDGL